MNPQVPRDAELISDPARHARIERLRKIAELMDGQFVIPGTNIQFGLDALIGLVPGIGDAICGVLSIWLIQEARQLGIPNLLVARMFWNVAVEVGIGVIPVLGDAFDVAWKANRMNMQLLSRYFDRHP